MDHDIVYTSSQVNDRIQLFFQPFICVLYLKYPTHRLWLVQYIAAVCRYDLISCCADQCDILHDHLTADTIKGSKLCSGYRSFAFLNLSDYLFSSFRSMHFLLPPPMLFFQMIYLSMYFSPHTVITSIIPHEDALRKYLKSVRNVSVLRWKYNLRREKSVC